MKNRLTAIAVAAGMLLGMGVANAPGAAAADCHFILCGKFKNSEDSEGHMWVAQGWPTVSNVKTLDEGDSSTDFYKDADAVKFPRYCTGWIGSKKYPGDKWFKIGDALHTRTVVVECE